MTPEQFNTLASALRELTPFTIGSLVIIAGIIGAPKILDAFSRLRAQEENLENLRLEQHKNLALAVEKSLTTLKDILQRSDARDAISAERDVQMLKLQVDHNNALIQMDLLRKKVTDCEQKLIDERVENEIARHEKTSKRAGRTRASLSAVTVEPAPNKL